MVNKGTSNSSFRVCENTKWGPFSFNLKGTNCSSIFLWMNPDVHANFSVSMLFSAKRTSWILRAVADRQSHRHDRHSSTQTHTHRHDRHSSTQTHTHRRTLSMMSKCIMDDFAPMPFILYCTVYIGPCGNDCNFDATLTTCNWENDRCGR